MKLANDLGYGSVKAVVDGEMVKFPSVIAKLRNQDIQDPIQFDNDQQQKAYMDGFLDQMDLTISSSALSSQGRYLVGKAAVDSALPLTKFDVNDFTGKSESDLSIILTLGLIAGKKVKEAYTAGDSLSETLKVNVTMTTALPVSEGKKNGVANEYKERYMGRTHTVTFNNFKDPITVTVTFDAVYVALEGETAQLYISHSDAKLKKALKDDFAKNYPELAKDVSEDDITGASNVIGLDIGEGTVDIVAIVDGKANALASNSLPHGYGNVLEEAIPALQQMKLNFEDRSKLQEYLEADTNALGKARKKRVLEVVKEQIDPFTEQIVDAASTVARKANADTNIMFVYGGGSIPMAKYSDLRARLNSKLQSFTGGEGFYVVWVPAEYAQELNEKGLELVLNVIAK